MKLCLVASHGYPPELIFHPPEFGATRLFREHQLGWNHESLRLCSFNPTLHQQESLKLLIEEPEDERFFRTHLRRRPGLVDFQDIPPDSLIIGLGIAEHCAGAGHDRTPRFIFPRSSEEESDGIALPEFFKLMGPQAQNIATSQPSLMPYSEGFFHDAESQPILLSPRNQFCSTEPLVVGDFNNSYLTHLPDRQLSFTNNGMELKDVLLSLTEAYSSFNSVKFTKQSMLVPYFDRRMSKRAKTNLAESPSKREPAKRYEKVNNGTSGRKKTNAKAVKEKDFYKNNYLHACESLLSLIVDKKRQDRNAILSLKRSGAEVPKLLTQFSASIAGTGLAVLLSVVCKVATGRVPFCASKLLNTGLGLGLMWLSWGVNKLRDTVMTINKNSGKLGVGEEEMMCNLDRNVRDIFFRVATLMAVVLLRFA